MQPHSSSRPDLFWFLFRQLHIGVVAAIITLNITNAICIALKPWKHRQSAVLMFGTEESPAAWVSSAILMMAFLMCMICRMTAERADRKWWLVMSLTLLAMSLDETATLHEYLGGLLNQRYEHALSFGWILPTAVGVLLGVCMFRFVIRLPAFTRRGIIVAFVVFAGSASGIDLIGGLAVIEYGNHTYIHYIMETIEENGELIGEWIMLVTLASHCRRAGLKLAVRPPANPVPATVENA